MKPKTKINNYAAFVASRLKSGLDIITYMTPAEANILHCAVGISGESGELLDGVKKAAIYRQEIDRENIIEELGDLEFYMEGLRAALNITRDETLVANVAKLSKRYEKGFSDAEAKARKDKK